MPLPLHACSSPRHRVVLDVAVVANLHRPNGNEASIVIASRRSLANTPGGAWTAICMPPSFSGTPFPSTPDMPRQESHGADCKGPSLLVLRVVTWDDRFMPPLNAAYLCKPDSDEAHATSPKVPDIERTGAIFGVQAQQVTQPPPQLALNAHPLDCPGSADPRGLCYISLCPFPQCLLWPSRLEPSSHLFHHFVVARLNVVVDTQN